ncbi:OsmC family protein [Blastococcus montanus]|uniref:OsmC family protein n=1 Tax=Blastococcus montanus TaxID=3144973 RepID=UPI00320859B1
MTGTFAGALTARRIDPTGLVGHARGEVELEGKVLVLKRIEVTYTGLDVPEQDAEKVQRVLAVHADGCPVARSLRGAIEITTRLG